MTFVVDKRSGNNLIADIGGASTLRRKTAARSGVPIHEVSGTLNSLALNKGQRVALVTGDDLTSSSLLAIDDLIAGLQRVCGAAIRWQKIDIAPERLEESVCILFGSPDNNPTLASFAASQQIDLSESALGSEGGIVRALAAEGKALVVLGGHTQQGACHATYSFLEQELGIGYFIDGDKYPKMDKVDLTRTDRIEKPTVPIRGLFHHSVWKHPHLNCWRLWGFPKWKQAIDWMRHKRFNRFLIFHDEGGYLWGDVIFRAFPEIPMNDRTLSDFVVDPTWRTELNKKIVAYARQCGLGISYNLFYSQVPEFFIDYHPDLKSHPLHMNNVGLECNQPECREIMLKFWGEILNTYGIDDCHNYAICSYAHETVLSDYLEDRNVPMLQAYEVMKQLDPEAKIYNETWCWKYTHERKPKPTKEDPLKPSRWLANNAVNYWRKFDAEMPKDLGVIEWDVVREPFPLLEKENFNHFNGRPYIQLTHTNFEGYWPPSTTRNHPAWLINLYNSAIDNGAEGVMYFHIQAGVYEMSADLAATIGWVSHPDLKEYYRDYARRRFGAEVADTLARSIDIFCDAVNLVFVLSPACFRGSGEDLLGNCESTGDERKAWIENKMQKYRKHADMAARAARLARSVPSEVREEPLSNTYFWELDYVRLRFDGIFALYRSHLLADTDPEKSADEFQKALTAFFAVKEMFRGRKEVSMDQLWDLEPDVPFTDSYRANWESRGHWGGGKADDAHVVWERFDIFEAKLRALRPVR